MQLAVVSFLARWVMWNCFLALVPVAMARQLAALLSHRPPFRLAAALLFLAWLAFVPNTAYLLTEWRHFLHHVSHTATSPSMDVALALFFAGYSGFGVLCLTLSLRPLHHLLPRFRAAIAAVTFGLISLGVYLGLVVRLNSWDLVLRPERVWDAASWALLHRSLLLLALAAVLWLLYTITNMLLDEIKR
ncbi:MAG: DUF1361 domain-containing protein [Candidatus Xenobia bacterium]